MGTAYTLHCADHTGHRVTMERKLVFLTLLVVAAANDDFLEKCLHKLLKCQFSAQGPSAAIGKAYLTGYSTSSYGKSLDIQKICSSDYVAHQNCYAEMKKMGCGGDGPEFKTWFWTLQKTLADYWARGFGLICKDENKSLLEKMKSSDCFLKGKLSADKIVSLTEPTADLKGKPCKEVFESMSHL